MKLAIAVAPVLLIFLLKLSQGYATSDAASNMNLKDVLSYFPFKQRITAMRANDDITVKIQAATDFLLQLQLLLADIIKQLAQLRSGAATGLGGLVQPVQPCKCKCRQGRG